MKTFKEIIEQKEVIKEALEAELRDYYGKIYINDGAFSKNSNKIIVKYVGVAQQDVAIKVDDESGNNPHFYLLDKAAYDKLNLKTEADSAGAYLKNVLASKISKLVKYGVEFPTNPSNKNDIVVKYRNGSMDSYSVEEADAMKVVFDKIVRMLKKADYEFIIKDFTSANSWLIKLKSTASKSELEYANKFIAPRLSPAGRKYGK